MTDCVILTNERLGSLSLNSLLLTQQKSSSPIWFRVLNILGSVGKVCCLYVCLLIIIDTIIDEIFVSVMGEYVFFVYYESRKWDLKTKPINECGDERLKTKSEKSTRLVNTGFLGELEHLKTETRLTDEMFVSVICSSSDRCPLILFYFFMNQESEN